MKIMKMTAWLSGLATLVSALVYMSVSLNRWQWNRTLFFGLVVISAEVALATGVILHRLGQIQRPDRRVDPRVLTTLRDTRPAAPNRFAWLAPDRTNVFITFLVGGGVVLSALAWLVDRIAARTTTPAGEERLARALGAISYPTGGLLVDDMTVLAQAVPGLDEPQLHTLLRRPGHQS